jgi:GAF domain-containing protein
VSTGSHETRTAGIETDASLSTALLRDIAHALGAEVDLAPMLQRCAEAIVSHLGAAFARVWVLDPATETLVLRASAGMYTHLDGGHSRIEVGAYKIGRIAAARAPHLSNDVVNDPELSDPEWARREEMVAFAGYPLLVADQLVGVLGLFARHSLSTEVLALLDAVAGSVALGIRRLDAEAELRMQGEVAEILYRSGTAVAQVHKLESIVQTVTDLATDLTAAQFGAFFYNAVDERGEAYTLYTLSGAPREAFEQFPLPRNTAIFDPTFRGTAIERHADITIDPRFGKNAPYNGMPEGHLPVRSYLAVPVVSRTGEVFGGLFFGHEQVGVFDERAERIAVGLAGHASAALDAVRVFELEHRLALNFQRTLLASSPPRVPGVRLVQQYVPASELAEIGGDWHDVVVLPDGTVALTIGDVVGHDLRAAVTMGRLRNAIQLYALDGLGPQEALARAEDYLTKAGIEDLATVLHARYDPTRRHLTMAMAGHLPPVIHRKGVDVEIPDFGGPILGTGLRHNGSEASVALEPGDVVVLYTDGLVERRDESLDEGVRRLRGVVASAVASTATSFCDTVIANMVAGEPEDDVAILAMFVDD